MFIGKYIIWLKKNYILVLLFYLFLLADPLFAYVDFPYAATFQTIRLPLLPLDNDPADEGNLIFRMNFWWMNVWSIQDNRFIIDGEELQVEPSVRYSFNRRIQGGLSWSFKVQGGGVLDPWIEGFHDAVNVTQGGRDRFAQKKINVSYETAGNYYPWIDSDPAKTMYRKYIERVYPRVYTDSPIGDYHLPYNMPPEVIPVAGKGRQGMDNPVAFLEYRTGSSLDLIDEIIIGASYRFSVVDSPELLASPGNDLSLYSVVKSRDRRTGVLYRLGASYTKFQKTHYYFLKLPHSQFVFRPAIEYRLDEWDAIVEYVYFSNPVDHFGELSRAGHQITLAFKRDYGDYLVTLGVVENFMNYGVTPDVGFLATIDFAQFSI